MPHPKSRPTSPPAARRRTARVRLLLAGLLAPAVALTCLGAGVTPAAATPGTSCVAPSIDGTVKAVLAPNGRNVSYTLNATGRTTAYCAGTLTEYKYELVVGTSWFSNDTDTAVSSGVSSTRTGSTISFTSASVSDNDADGVLVSIIAYSKTSPSRFWSEEEFHTYYIEAPAPRLRNTSTTTAFDTASMSEAHNACMEWRPVGKGPCTP